ncbi:glycosyltransferase family 9 protein [Amycolatopsis sp. FDAARGOS 1241]|uniref:glycosyltransferase family 9 protein n=1 Tax=Amycolatopsis sp. FDAARGOS 1241 TaxID=2778070 RepID=UPI00194F53CB|nr:glycosyltransferase family 9 protein [Amycolatopsis sp. FDAARGOS 1241]QRP49717.1 glycosyltransferase family 9 protein [Amycolatopsis sp. FDAARGOS 1241]
MAVSAAILVLRALGIGDLLTAVPALRALHEAHPDERLVLAAPRELRDLAELIDAVDELLPTAGLGKLAWPGPPPKLAVNLHGNGPESIHDLLATEPGRLLTHRHPDFPDVPGLEWRADVHEADRWCRLVEYAHLEADRSALRLPAPPGPSPAPGAVVVHPGAAFPARRWPPERFARVVRDLAQDGHRVVITGSAAELDLARGIARDAGLPHDAILAGATDLAELASLVAEAALVICGDTGVGHLATAFATPSVLLFGPTPPRLWGPPPDARQHRVLWSGDVGDPHGNRPDEGLLLLGEDRVLAAARSALAAQVRHG